MVPLSARVTRASRAVGRHRGDLLALGVLAGLVLAYLAPALGHGPSFGPSDLGRQLSLLTNGPGPVHNAVDSDLITQGLPWNNLNWTLVHQGRFPLWNSYSGNGIPQFLNFESGSLAVPSLIGYLFPLSWSFLVTVAVKLLVAGWGTYLCCRLLGASPLAAIFGGASFMLSGPVTGWLGWAISGVFVWGGFLLAGLILAGREPGRARGIVLVALAGAAAVYGGFPEGDLLLGGGLAVLLAVTAAGRHREEGVIRGAGRIGAGLALAGALAAPLWLPGLAVLGGAAREGVRSGAGLPAGETTLAVAQGYCGLPTGGSWLCAGNYYETAATVGVVGLALALAALVLGWRRPVVRGLGAALVATVAVVYRLGPVDPVQALLRDLGLGVVKLNRMLPVATLALAVLAALGLEALLGRTRVRRVEPVLALAGLAVGIWVALLWVSAFEAGLSGTVRTARRGSLVWPTALILLCLAVTLGPGSRRGLRARPGSPPRVRWLAAGALLAGQVSYLVVAGAGLNSYAPSAVSATPATVELEAQLGTGLLGFDGGNTSCAGSGTRLCGFRAWTGVGFPPAMNLLVGLPELGVHDPVVPAAYLAGWPVPGAGQRVPASLDVNFFAPAVDTVALARLYGVTEVLAAPGVPAPVGMTPVTTIRGMTLYRVPDSGLFTVSRSGTSTVVPGTHPGDDDYRVRLDGGPASVLTARITDFPGWSARAGGRALVLHRTGQDLIRVDIPAGTTVVELRYRPAGLTEGAVLAAAAVAALGVRALIRRRAQERV